MGAASSLGHRDTFGVVTGQATPGAGGELSRSQDLGAAHTLRHAAPGHGPGGPQAPPRLSPAGRDAASPVPHTQGHPGAAAEPWEGQSQELRP